MVCTFIWCIGSNFHNILTLLHISLHFESYLLTGHSPYSLYLILLILICFLSHLSMWHYCICEWRIFYILFVTLTTILSRMTSQKKYSRRWTISINRFNHNFYVCFLLFFANNFRCWCLPLTKRFINHQYLVYIN